jgi:FixJ family two-component response regulator
MRDLLTDGENAFLFRPGDEHSCREAIERAADADDATLQRMGARAAGVARLHCDARRESEMYLEVFHANADRNARHALPARVQS